MPPRGTVLLAAPLGFVYEQVCACLCPACALPAAVCVILARAFHPRVSALVLLTFGAYAAWTVALTRVRLTGWLRWLAGQAGWQH